MKCEICGQEFPSKSSFKISGVCIDCFDNLPQEKKIDLEKKIKTFSIREKEKNSNEYEEFKYKKLVIIAVAAIIISFIIYNLGGHWILYILGVSLVAGIMYAIYESIVEVLAGLITILGGVSAYYLSKENILPWYLSVLICGVIVGFLITPFLIIVDVKKIKRSGL